MNRRLYALHRWVSLVALLQLLAWSVSGFFFAVVPKPRLMSAPIDGAHDIALDAQAVTLAAADLGARARDLGVGEVRKIEIRGSDSGPTAIVTGSKRRIRLDARTGRERPVERDEAIAVARRDQPLSPREADVEHITTDPPIEYRDKPLPAWRVVLDDGKGTAIYVDATSGEVTARRNGIWRTYDFLWSLHIMAYNDREDFRHPLLACAAGITVLTALTGTVLWTMRVARRRKRAAKAA